MASSSQSYQPRSGQESGILEPKAATLPRRAAPSCSGDSEGADLKNGGRGSNRSSGSSAGWTQAGASSHTGVLCCNWDNQDPRQFASLVADIRASPAHILVLQAAPRKLKPLLEPPDEADSSTKSRRHGFDYVSIYGPGVGEGGEYAPGLYVDELGVLHERRPSTCSLMVAARTPDCRVDLLKFNEKFDGTYRRNSCTIEGFSKFQVVYVAFKKPRSGLHGLCILNTQPHHRTARYARGFKVAHVAFWDEVASLILQYDVRMLAGDFQASLWRVIPMLQARGIHMQLAAWRVGWHPGTGDGDELLVDSCGIFVRGARSIAHLYTARDLHLGCAGAAGGLGRGHKYDFTGSGERYDDDDDVFFEEMFAPGAYFPLKRFLGAEPLRGGSHERMQEYAALSFATVHGQELALPAIQQVCAKTVLGHFSEEAPLLIVLGNDNPKRHTRANRSAKRSASSPACLEARRGRDVSVTTGSCVEEGNAWHRWDNIADRAPAKWERWDRFAAARRGEADTGPVVYVDKETQTDWWDSSHASRIWNGWSVWGASDSTAVAWEGAASKSDAAWAGNVWGRR